MKEIIESLKKIEIEDGILLEQFIKKPTESELEIVTDLKKTYLEDNCIYNNEELLNLERFKMPRDIIDFYREMALEATYDIGGDVNLLSLADMKYENCEMIPGAYLIRFGVITFATTTGGNAICYDLNSCIENEPRIIFADRSIFNDKKITVYEEGRRLKKEISYEIISQYAVQISDSFSAFLKMIINGDIEDIEEFVEEL